MTDALIAMGVVYGLAAAVAYLDDGGEVGAVAFMLWLFTVILPVWGLCKVIGWVLAPLHRMWVYEHDERPSSDPTVQAMAAAMVAQYQNSPAARANAEHMEAYRAARRAEQEEASRRRREAYAGRPDPRVEEESDLQRQLTAAREVGEPPVRVDVHRIAREGYMLRIGDRVIDTDEIRAWRDSSNVVLRVVGQLTPPITLVEANRLLELVRPLLSEAEFPQFLAGLRGYVNADPPPPPPAPRAALVEGERNLEL